MPAEREREQCNQAHGLIRKKLKIVIASEHVTV